mgnify:CR=1 FL=1
MWAARVRVLVDQRHWPSTSVQLPIPVVPSRKVIVPVAAAGVTVAVSVSDWPQVIELLLEEIVVVGYLTWVVGDGLRQARQSPPPVARMRRPPVRSPHSPAASSPRPGPASIAASRQFLGSVRVELHMQMIVAAVGESFKLHIIALAQ